MGPESPIKDALAQNFFVSAALRAVGDGHAGQRRRCASWLTAAGADPLDYYAEGVIEASILHQALQAAYDAGDMTQAGVLAAAKALESVTFDGLAPDETYVGEPNDRVQRAQFISRPDPAGLAGGTSTGVTLVESMYTSPIAEAFEFNEACFALS